METLKAAINTRNQVMNAIYINAGLTRSSSIAEESPQPGKAVVARLAAVASGLLEMVKKSQDHVRVEVLKRELVRWLCGFARDKLQQELETVSVVENGVGAQTDGALRPGR